MSEREHLCEEMRGVLQAELRAGNELFETLSPWPTPSGPLLMLRYHFRLRPEELPEEVEMVEINDPHYWKAEYHCKRHPGQMLACRFD